jgi:hypothetical protein
MRRHTPQARRNAARTAAKQLRTRGITALNGHLLLRDGGVDWLADIARHIGSLNPTEIGAAALLEADGWQRTNDQLTLLEENPR